jgi:hypothetical protein
MPLNISRVDDLTTTTTQSFMGWGGLGGSSHYVDTPTVLFRLSKVEVGLCQFPCFTHKRFFFKVFFKVFCLNNFCGEK